MVLSWSFDIKLHMLIMKLIVVDLHPSVASVPHKPSKVKPKRLDRPPVAGPSIAHKSRIPMLFNGTRDQLNN